MKKRIWLCFLALVLAFSFSACSNKRLIVATSNVQADIMVDYSTVDKMVPDAEIIVSGKIEDIIKTVYVPEDGAFATYAHIRCEKVYQGEPGEVLEFAAGGGYVPYPEYVQSLPSEDIQKLHINVKEAKLQKGFVKCQFANPNLIEEGKEYLLFLRREPSSRLFNLFHGVIEVKGNQLYREENGPPLDQKETVALIEKTVAAEGTKGTK